MQLLGYTARITCCFIIWSALLAHHACAQNYVDLARITYANTALNQFDSSDAQTRVQEMIADITLPIKLNESTAIITGINYENLQARISPIKENVTSAYGTLLKVGLNKQHNAKWRGTYMLLPKLSSDLKSIGKRDFQLGATVIMKYKKSEFLTYQFGALYNSELFGPFFVPLFGLYYKSPNQKFEMTVLLPASVDMNFALTPKITIGGNFLSFVKSYHLNDRFDGTNTLYWVKSTNEIFGYLQFAPTKSLLFQLKGGYSIARHFSAYEVGDRVDWGLAAFKFGDDRKRLNPYFSDGAILQIRFIYRFFSN